MKYVDGFFLDLEFFSFSDDFQGAFVLVHDETGFVLQVVKDIVFNHHVGGKDDHTCLYSRGYFVFEHVVVQNCLFLYDRSYEFSLLRVLLVDGVFVLAEHVEVAEVAKELPPLRGGEDEGLLAFHAVNGEVLVIFDADVNTG